MDNKESIEESQVVQALTLGVPEDVYQGLIQHAVQTGQSPEAVAVQLLVTALQHRGDDPVEQFLGAFRSHAAGWADPHDANLEKASRGSMDPTTSKGDL
jgi:hypothetical protein